MAVTLEKIKTDDEDLNRVQKNVGTAIAALSAQAAAARPSPTTSGPTYKATGAELVIFAASAGGPVSIILPTKPSGLVIVRNVANGTVTVSAAGATIDGKPMTSVAALGTLILAFDGRNWWSLG